MSNWQAGKIPRLETGRYILRGIKEEDAKELFPFMSDRKTMRFITPHPVDTEEKLQCHIKASLYNYADSKEIPWVITHKETNEIIGMFRLHKLHLWHKKAELGAIIREEYQRSGVMTEIMGEVLRFGFEELQLNRIVGDIFEGNHGSARLLNKFGFTKEGQLRQTDFDGENFHDTIVYSLLRQEYEKLCNQK
ncbi:GNAT family N-acetyltransferase [Evansella clarkii]|uniref:GNAT family N-acetyltransferase n=1 Tax=Evansella clarkii TaxID=79879 RepID=UPI000B43F854|nr:GNAT family N-acetyltransferase [Evansella clarkii]